MTRIILFQSSRNYFEVILREMFLINHQVCQKMIPNAIIFDFVNELGINYF